MKISSNIKGFIIPQKEVLEDPIFEFEIKRTKDHRKNATPILQRKVPTKSSNLPKIHKYGSSQAQRQSIPKKRVQLQYNSVFEDDYGKINSKRNSRSLIA